MANEKRLIDANELEAKFHETKMIEIFPYWKELNFDTQCELVRFGKALKKMMQNAPTVDAVEACYCDSCVNHGNCLPEDIFRMARIKKPYCCAGKVDGDRNA